MLLSPSQDRLLRLASYRRDAAGVSVTRLAHGELRTAQALINGLLAVVVDERLYSTRRGEVQIELENDRIARAVRRARRKV